MECENNCYFKDFIYGGLAAFYLYDLIAGRYIWHNGKFGQMLGIADHELEQNPAGFAIKNYHPDDLHLVKKRQEYFTQNDRWVGYYRLRHTIGNYLWVFSKDYVTKRDATCRPTLIAGMMTEANGGLENQHQLISMAKEEMQILHRQKYEALTKREKEVLRHIAAGLSYTQIATLLNIEPGTVNRHRKNIQQKLELHNIAMLACFAKEVGLV